jgi:hypothetical protein
VTVQAAELLDVRVAGVQVRALGRVGPSKPREKLRELPGKVAVRLAVLSEVIVRAEAVKVAVVVPAVTVTEVGTVNNALFLDKATEVPPTGAGLLRLTVQEAVAAELKVVGLQVKLVSRVGATRLREKLRGPLAGDAVMVAVLSVRTVEAVAEKVAEVEPAGMVTEAGTDNTLLLEDRATTVPPAGAVWLVVRVQELMPPEVRELGVQVSELAGVISMALRAGFSMTWTS